jgi:hypothetical protein
MEAKTKRDGRRYVWNAFAIVGIFFTGLLLPYILLSWVVGPFFDFSPLPSHSEQVRRFSRNRSAFDDFANEVANGRIEFREDETPNVKFVKAVPDRFQRLGILMISVRKQEGWLLFEYASGPLDNSHYVIKPNGPLDPARWHQITNLTDGWFLVCAK